MEEYQQLLERAAKICLSVHAEQRDKAGKAYFLHPLSIAVKCETDEEKIVALLHDVVEDGDINGDFLIRNGFSNSVVDAIISLTKKEEEEYDDFIKRLASNSLARKVKIKDLEDNLNILRLKNLNENDLVRCNKYLKALDYLKNYKEESDRALKVDRGYTKARIKPGNVEIERTDSIFYIEGAEWTGKGQLTTDGRIIVLKDSVLRANITNTYSAHKIRNEVIKKYCTLTEKGFLVNEDLPPMSPSGSSGIVQGRSSNGKQDWKDSTGKSLGYYLENP